MALGMKICTSTPSRQARKARIRSIPFTDASDCDKLYASNCDTGYGLRVVCISETLLKRVGQTCLHKYVDWRFWGQNDMNLLVHSGTVSADPFTTCFFVLPCWVSAIRIPTMIIVTYSCPVAMFWSMPEISRSLARKSMPATSTPGWEILGGRWSQNWEVQRGYSIGVFWMLGLAFKVSTMPAIYRRSLATELLLPRNTRGSCMHHRIKLFSSSIYSRGLHVLPRSNHIGSSW